MTSKMKKNFWVMIMMNIMTMMISMTVTPLEVEAMSTTFTTKKKTDLILSTWAVTRGLKDSLEICFEIWILYDVDMIIFNFATTNPSKQLYLSDDNDNLIII